jgi:peptidoglycan/LPS O-acetylase OafA/YrhL
MTFAEYRASSYFPGLNGLRGIAICAVIWHHCYYGTVKALGRGFLGVDLFFVLSGFLIVTLLLRERDASGTIALGRFWVRRSLRLMPALYLLLAILTVFYAAHSTNQHARQFFGSLPAYAIYLSNWIRTDAPNLAILWSLATEEQFYIVWPLIERFLRALAWPLLLLFLLVNQLANFHVLDPVLVQILPHPLTDYEILEATYTPICLGVALARLAHYPRSFAALPIALGQPVAPYAIIAALAALIGLAPADISGICRLTIQLLMTALIGAVVLQPRHGFATLLESRILARIGIVSYGLYLYHLWALHVARFFLTREQINEPLLLFAITLPVSLVMAEISFRLFESPILAFAHRFRPKRTIAA